MNRETTKNLAKKRQGYLRQKAAIYSFAAIGCGVLVGLTLTSIVTGQFFFALDMGALCYWLFNVSVTKIEDMPRVPPVPEQVAALPANQILVRGSELPSAAPKELLRAAQKGSKAASEQLLRSDESPKA